MNSQRTVSSRLIKQERKKVVRQIFIFAGLALILVLIFIFVVLPLFIRFINSVLNTNPIADDEVVLLQAPVISAPVSATNSAQLKINGFDSPDHEIVVVLNGQEHTTVNTSEDGSFSADVELTEGENSLTSYSVDADDNESKAGHSYTVILDTEKPELTISEPAEGATIDARENLVTITGATEAGSRVYINDRSIFPNSDGSFSTRHSLTEGKNEIKIKAIDRAGNEIEQTLNVEYRP